MFVGFGVLLGGLTPPFRMVPSLITFFDPSWLFATVLLLYGQDVSAVILFRQQLNT